MRDAYRKTQPAHCRLGRQVMLPPLSPSMTVVVGVGVVTEFEAKGRGEAEEAEVTVDRQCFFHQPVTVEIDKAG